MEEKIVYALNDLGYKGHLLKKEQLEAIIQEEVKTEYSQLVNYLTDEIRGLINIDEKVNVITNSENAVAFILEISSFLKELNCPYSSLIQGHVSDRLQNTSDLLLLLDYLITELMAARIVQEKRPTKRIELKIDETKEAADLKRILITLNFPKPPSNLTVSQLFQKLIPTVDAARQKSTVLRKSALSGTLSSQQWSILKELETELQNEYKIRREMMLTRLDVTIQSFQWSDKAKVGNDNFEKMYAIKRKNLKSDSNVHVADVLAARDDVSIIDKTSSASVRKNTKSLLNKVIIGEVPDRGGRTSEQIAPPPEMPSWQKRTPETSVGGRGGRESRGAFLPQHRRGGSNYERSYQNQGESSGTNNRGTYNNSYQNFESASRSDHGYDSRSNYDKPFDSAGSYGPEHYGQNSKRAKTFESFQSNRTTYADQYVQEEQHNQQYYGHSGRGANRRGRGRSNRGGGRNNYH